MKNNGTKQRKSPNRGAKQSRLSDNPVDVVRRGPYDTISRLPPPLTSIYTVRTVTQTSALLSVTPTSSQNPTYVFTLSDVDNAVSFTGLFDQYRIECVCFKLLPMQNAIGLTTNSTTTCVTPAVVIDYDDNTAITTTAGARSFESCILVPPGESCTRTFRPRMAVAAYTGSFSGYANMDAQWIDAGSPTVAHYGVKLFIPGATAAQTQLQSWTVEREYWISYRKVHG
jgi:hypothetical protein